MIWCGLNRAFVRFCYLYLLLTIPVWAASACGAADYSSNQTIVRQMGGVRHEGRFIPPYCYEWFVRAERFAALGELEKAVEAYRLALTGPEEDAFILARLAEALHELGRTEASLKALERAEAIDSRSEAVWLTRARFAEQRGDYKVAISAYQRAEAAAPLSAEPPLALAHLLNKIHAAERADAVLQGFAARTRDNSALAERAKLALCLAKRDAQGAVDAVEAMLRIAPIRKTQICNAISLALNSDEPFLAEGLLSRISANRCEKGLRLRVYLKTHRLGAAEQLLASALPEDFGGLLPTARAYLAIDRPDLAEELAEVRLARGESNEAMLIAAESKLRQGRFTEAARSYSRIQRGTASYEAAMIGLVRTLGAQGMEGVAAEVLATTPQRTLEICSALAERRLRQDDLVGAEAALNSNCGSRPQTEEARAAVLERIGETKQAFRIYASLGRDREAERVTSRVQAEWLIARGHLKGAIQLLETETKASPENLLARIRLAEVKAQAGDVDEARSIARALLGVIWEPALRRRIQAIATQR